MNRKFYVSPEERKRLVRTEGVTLDGRPAIIRGWHNEFGTVCHFPQGESHEWAWATIRDVVSRDGKFKS